MLACYPAETHTLTEHKNELAKLARNFEKLGAVEEGAAATGPTVAYVDDAASVKAQLTELLPSLQHVIADITHVLRRYGETVTPHHSKLGESSALAAVSHSACSRCALYYACIAFQPWLLAMGTTALAKLDLVANRAGDFTRDLSNAIFVRVDVDEAEVRQFHASSGAR